MEILLPMLPMMMGILWQTADSRKKTQRTHKERYHPPFAYFASFCGQTPSPRLCVAVLPCVEQAFSLS
jgi:hypothetical protein